MKQNDWRQKSLLHFQITDKYSNWKNYSHRNFYRKLKRIREALLLYVENFE